MGNIIKKLLVAIDAGHGLGNIKQGVYDPGAVSDGFSEASINLQWALTFKERARLRGVGVFLVRTGTDDANPIGGRDDQARDAGATHFISIHCNAADTRSATGTETYYRDAADKVLAQAVQSAALAALGLKDRGLKLEGASQHSWLAVLNFVPPACLLEIGFITNLTDRAKMLDKDVRIAWADKVIDWLLANG